MSIQGRENPVYSQPFQSMQKQSREQRVLHETAVQY